MDRSSDCVTVSSLGPAWVEDGIVVLAPSGVGEWMQLARQLGRFAQVRLVTYAARCPWPALCSRLDAIAMPRLHLVVGGPITKAAEFAAWLHSRSCASRIVVGDPGLIRFVDLVVADAACLAGDGTIREFLQRVVAID